MTSIDQAPVPRLGRLRRGWGLRSRLAGLLALSLVGLSAVLGLVTLNPAPACACSCAVTGLEDQAAAANVIVSGTLSVASTPADPATVTYTATAARVYKGELATAEFSFATPANAASCGLGALAPGDYIFFLQGADGAWTADSCGGTGLLTPDYATKITAKLGTGKAWSAPIPTEATLTPQETAAPTSLARLAAPGAALALLGLLGLMLARRLGRRA